MNFSTGQNGQKLVDFNAVTSMSKLEDRTGRQTDDSMCLRRTAHFPESEGVEKGIIYVDALKLHEEIPRHFFPFLSTSVHLLASI